MNRPLLIGDGLFKGQDGLLLHPTLAGLANQLGAMKRRWFICRERNPLAWYASMADISPAAVLAAHAADLSADTRQCWVASPYHAQLGRDKVRLLAEGAMPWSEEDAAWVSEQLNPLLAEEGMRLCRAGAALLLACSEPVEADPAPFAEVAGNYLPDRLPSGADGGRLVRLLSEIQMLLHGRSSDARRSRGEPDINGLWLWGACDWPATQKSSFPVATRNPFLQPLVDGRNARLTLSEAERLDGLVRADARLPKQIVLAGGGHAVLLERSLIPGRRKKDWQPESPKAEDELISLVKGWLR